MHVSVLMCMRALVQWRVARTQLGSPGQVTPSVLVTGYNLIVRVGLKAPVKKLVPLIAISLGRSLDRIHYRQSIWDKG
mgnify:CR=1 FL=1